MTAAAVTSSPTDLESRRQQYALARSTMPPREWCNNIRVSLRGRWAYIENAKAGCSTIKKTLFHLEVANTPLNKGDRYENVAPKLLHESLFGPTLSLAQLPEASAFEAVTDPSFYRFSFVRNPFTRTLSAFLDKIAKAERRERARFLARADIHLDKPLTFAVFLEQMTRKPALLTMDKHWRPQTRNLAEIPLNRLGRFESFEEDLSEILGVLIDRAPETYQGAQPSIKSHAKHQSNAATRLDEYYGEEEAAMVRELYRADFERYGYSTSLDQVR